MDLEMLTVGSLFTNCYVVWCSKTKEAIVIDPGFDRRGESEKVLGVLRENGLRVKFVVDTHGHPDHVCGNGVVKEATGALVLIHELDAGLLGEVGRGLFPFGSGVVSCCADGFLVEGGVVEFGEVVLRVLHTPGHSRGSVSLVGEGCVFSGDTLFAGSVGRWDLPGGSGVELLGSLRRLAGLPDGFVVYPGHGPKSTVGEEKSSNPFLREGFDVSVFRE
jgi:hydroxyacylglutathione hydrolase